MFSLSISKLSTLDFKLAKSTFVAKDYISIPVAFFKFVFVAYLDKSNSTFTVRPKHFVSGKHSLSYTKSFLSTRLLKELW